MAKKKKKSSKFAPVVLVAVALATVIFFQNVRRESGVRSAEPITFSRMSESEQAELLNRLKHHFNVRFVITDIDPAVNPEPRDLHLTEGMRIAAEVLPRLPGYSVAYKYMKQASEKAQEVMAAGLHEHPLGFHFLPTEGEKFRPQTISLGVTSFAGIKPRTWKMEVAYWDWSAVTGSDMFALLIIHELAHVVSTEEFVRHSNQPLDAFIRFMRGTGKEKDQLRWGFESWAWEATVHAYMLLKRAGRIDLTPEKPLAHLMMLETVAAAAEAYHSEGGVKSREWAGFIIRHTHSMVRMKDLSTKE